MDWERLLKNQLPILGEELGAEVEAGLKKHAIVGAIDGLNLSSEDNKETWNGIQKQHERQERREEQERQERREQEREQWKESLKVKQEETRRSIQCLRWSQVNSRIHAFEEGEDIESYLTSYENVGTDKGLDEDYWSIALLSVLPCDLMGRIGYLSEEEFNNYNEAKAALLRCFGVRVDRKQIEYKLTNAPLKNARWCAGTKTKPERGPRVSYSTKVNSERKWEIEKRERSEELERGLSLD
ncbi:hypothetical protein HPB51_028043 [Rhipicephalus microplus]|uniref:Uncharacterized protein n=1 Tax=Rhipicephalus microplus TaxID=6941 RepID=A0A9J6CYD9_RHIMP|nr:hypothetical protein HPB51_028043 [Rhipicephalus microplus]